MLLKISDCGLRQMLAICVLGFSFATAQNVIAQQATTPNPAQNYSSTEQQDARISDEQLTKFMVAMTAVQSLQQEYMGKLQAAETDSQSQELREEAQNKMISAVENSGLTVDDYNAIAQKMRTDPSLAERAESLN